MERCQLEQHLLVDRLGEPIDHAECLGLLVEVAVAGADHDRHGRKGRIGKLLPAMGYGDQQIRDLEATIRNTPCDLVLIATPIDLRRIVKLDKEALRVGYDLEEIGEPKLGTILARFQAETAKHRS